MRKPEHKAIFMPRQETFEQVHGRTDITGVMVEQDTATQEPATVEDNGEREN